MKDEKNKNGNIIKRGFSFAGCAGTEYNLMQRWLEKGFKQLYCTAPYYWGLVNNKILEIFTYTEGDLTHINCNNEKSFKKELQDYKQFLKKEEIEIDVEQ